VSRTAGAAADGAERAVDRGADAVRGAADAGVDTYEKSSGGGFWKWLIPLILAVLAWFGYKQINKDVDVSDAAGDAATTAVEATKDAAATATEGASDAVDTAKDAAATATDAAKDAAATATEGAADAVDAAKDAAATATDAAKDAAANAAATASDAVADLGGKVTDLFGSASETLSGITDVESAKAALPKLEEASGTLDGLTGMLSGAGDDAKSAVATAAEKGMGALTPILEKLQSNESIWAVIGPVIEPLLEKLKALLG
jgi:uncharacterized phage infection (PIP) family protein YhgE